MPFVAVYLSGNLLCNAKVSLGNLALKKPKLLLTLNNVDLV